MRIHFFLDDQKDKPTYKYRDLDWIPRIGESIHFGGGISVYRINEVLHKPSDSRFLSSVVVVASLETDYKSKIVLNKLSNQFDE